MFIKKPNEVFKIAFRAKPTNLTSSDFTLSVKKMSDMSDIDTTATVAHLKEHDYYVENISFADEGEYLFCIDSPSNAIELRALIDIKIPVSYQPPEGATYGIIY